MRRRSFALVLVLALGAVPAAAAPRRPIDLPVLRELATLQDPQIAPDGQHVVLIVRRADFRANAYRNELVLVDARTGARRTLVRERDDVSSPRWSPRGDRIAFIATPPKDDAKPGAAPAEPAPQLYVLRLDGGEPARITTAAKGVESFAWRPDGGGFAYVAQDESPDAKRIEAHDDWFEVGDEAWTARAAPLAKHLWTIRADGTRARRITRGAFSLDAEPAFARDGRTVYTVRTPVSTNRYRRRAIVAIALPGGRIRTLTAAGRSADAPVVSPDGTRLAYGAEHPAAFSQTEAYVRNLSGGSVRDLSARLDRSVQFALFAPRGEVVVGANDGTRDRLFALAADGTPRALPLGEVDLSGSATVAHDGTLAFVGTSAQRPAELYLLRPGAPAPRRLTDVNRTVAARALAPTRTIAWRSADGFAPTGVLTEPVGMVRGRRYPLVVVIHGGPTATSTLGFSSLAQLLAARGWLVFAPNYRGSDNQGRRFAQATVPHIASAPARDVLDGIAAVERLGIVDATRIGVSGWSEGGLLTSWLIGHDHRWRAAVSGAAVNDWTAYADLTDAQDFTPAYLGGSPWTNPRLRALYDAESPLTYAAAVTTPTLLMSDSGDQRVPTPLAYEFYHALRAAGTPTELVIVPARGHFPSDPLHREDVNRRWVDWFATHF